MCAGLGPCDAGWAEELPPACPPSKVRDTGDEVVYRLVTTNPATIEDFRSQRFMTPDKRFRASDCVARALSVWSTAEKCRAARKWPAQKQKVVASVLLAQNTGSLLPSASGHLSWWRCSAFDPLPRTNVLPE